MHFSRPEWALALIVFALLPLLARKTRSVGGAWSKICDPQLLKALLIESRGKSLFGQLLLLGVCWGLAVFALTGPAVEKLPQPTFSKGADVVYLLDVSPLMGARDLKPSRMERAVFKLYDLLQRNAGAQSALVLYASTPFTAVPLTPDLKMIENVLPTVQVGLMGGTVPNLAAALDEAEVLLRQAKAVGGRVAVLGAFADASAVKAAKRLKENGFTVSVLGIGTTEGAPVQLADGNFATVNGQAVLSSLPVKELKQTAAAGGGVYRTVSLDEADIDALSAVKAGRGSSAAADGKIKADAWKDLGAYFAALILPFMALGFRRGWLGVLLFSLFPAQAQASWTDFWQREDYKAAVRITQGQKPESADVFQDFDWKGAAQYKSEDYQAAADSFAKGDSAENLYNYGNALAHAGKIQDAIKAYAAALKQDPNHADAAFNKKYLEDRLKQNQSNQNQNQKQKQDKQRQGAQNQSQNAQNARNGQSGQNQKPQPQNQNEQRQNEQRQNEQRQNEQRQGERQQNEQNEQSGQPRQQGSNGEKQPSRPRSAEQRKAEKKPEGEKIEAPKSAAEQREEQAKQEQRQWLSVIDDDPSGLLRERIRRHNLNRRTR